MTHLLQRSALILLASTALTACVSPYAPVLPVPPPAPAAPPPQVAAATEKPPEVPPAPAPVESRPLEALPPAPAQPAAPAIVPPPPAAPAPRLAAPPPAPAELRPPREPSYRTVTTRAVSGKVVEIEGEAEAYKVRKGDTLEKIADRLDTDIQQLAKDNKLRKPYRLRPGQLLKGPPTRAKAYVVGQGDTLFSIAKRFNVSVEALRDANDLGRNRGIAPGHKLRLPDRYHDRGPLVSTSRVEVDQEEAPPPIEPTARRGRRAETPTPVVDEAPQGRLVTTRSVAGRVVEVATPGKAYKVRKGDNLEKVARKLDSEIDDLARLNRLKKPYRLHPGQTLRGPGSSAKAYVVGSGDTLAGIARRFDVSVEELRAANGLRRGASVAPGRKLRLPAGYRDHGPVVTTTRLPAEAEPRPSTAFRTPPPPASQLPPPAPSNAEALPSSPRPYTPLPRPYTPPSRSSTPQGGVTGAPVASAPVSDAQIMQLGRGLFAWPMRGDIISGFGGKGNGQRNDGLNIRAMPGDAVRAAAAGDVVYAGDQVPGFGNLVLIKHADGWVTAYGHLAHVDVHMQQKVAQGQQIGQAGSSGGVSEPQLHFEVRYAPTPQERARPVDPQLVLPK